jgi:hypothetical protein
MEKVAKNGRKVKGIALLFCCFLAIYVALTFRPFLADVSILHKWGKNSKKVRLYPLLFVHF